MLSACLCSITTGSNRLASYSQTDMVSGSPVNTTTTYSLNANGDTTGDGTRSYGFDATSRLASTSTGSSPSISTSRYSHNALGQRTFKTLPIIGTPATADPGYAFTYDEDGTLLGDYGAAGTPSAGSTEYIWLPTPNGPVPVAAIINGVIFAVQADHLNTPRRLSNTSAQAVWQWKYSAFGDEQPTLAANRFADLTMNPNPGTTSIPAITFNLRYPGQYADSESGLYYNYFRSYSSDTGRYTQADPIGLDGGWNRFGYVEGSPLSSVDARGLTDSSYLDRVGVTARGLATGAFGALVGVIAASPPDGVFNNIGSTLYDNPGLAQDFQNGHNFGFLLGVGGAMGGSRAGNGGGLTTAEIRQIQAVVNAAGRPLDVVGSAAAGNRRGAGTNLPIGKGPGTRSDIDYVAVPSSLPYFNPLQNKLPSIDPKTGVVPGCPNPNIGPSIRFEPR